MTDDNIVQVSLHIAAPPDVVFPYFTDPDRYTQWMGGTATLEPKPGGVYRVTMRDGLEAQGEFVEVVPPHRVVFTWGWNHDQAVPPGSTRVVVTLEPDGAGTRVVLQQHDLPDEAQRAHHRLGWEMYVDRLGLRATGGNPGPDPELVAGPTAPGRWSSRTRLPGWAVGS